MKSKKRIDKIICTMLALAFSFAVMGACSNKGDVPPIKLPEYNTAREFTFAGGGPGDGTFRFDKGDYTVSESLQTEQGYTVFKDSGLDTLILRDGFGAEEDFQKSEMKRVADIAYETGVKKIFIQDLGITDKITYAPQKVVDPSGGGRFLTETDLDAFITGRLSMYINEPYFYGITFPDEPFYQQTAGVGEIYRSVKRCAAALGKPDTEIFINLNPCMVDNVNYDCYGKVGTYENLEEIYTKYLEDYATAMQADSICVDFYPFTRTGFKRGFYPNLQKLREICDKYGAKMSYYAQAYSEFSNGLMISRPLGQADIYHNINSLIGYGVDKIFWFRYCPWYSNENNQNQWYDRASLIDKYGNPTDAYYGTQRVLNEFRSFEKVILSYDFKGSKLFTGNGVAQYGTSGYFITNEDSATGTVMEFDNSYEFNVLKDVKINNDISLVTELHDGENNLYMYMLMNAIDPYYSAFGNTAMTVEANFGAEYEWVAEWERGVLNYVRLENGVYKKDLSAGYASFVIPLK